MKKYLLIVTIVFFASCENNSNAVSDNTIKEFYGNGALKSTTMFKNKVYKRKINYYQNGEIESIFNYKDEVQDGEQLWFNDNGILDQKVIYDMGVRNGNAYFFYPSGTLKHSRFFRFGKEVLFGADYWDDSLNLIKSSLHFNDSGHIYYKKNFDPNGKFLSEEGNRE